ncbi:protein DETOXIFICATION 27-like isoform X2 [Punica granatum]|uniref:Protein DETOXIFICATION n=1 Tax=Punica granatum TaxID=22663 RepID=A0A6P8C478_PUNGR|nr:protein DETOXIFICATION 27-like isoform X2 [Punica granatum]
MGRFVVSPSLQLAIGSHPRDCGQSLAVPEQIDGEESNNANDIWEGEAEGTGAGPGELLLWRGVWRETKKLWQILGPAIFNRLASYTMNIVTQAFAGHLGKLELAAMSNTITVIVSFNFGLLLGMASALETLCGQAYGAKRYNMLGIYVQRSFIVLTLCCSLLLPLYIFAAPLLRLLGQPKDVAELTGELALWMIPFHFSFAFSLPLNRFFQSQLKIAVISWLYLAGMVVNVAASWLCVHVLGFGVFSLALCLGLSWWVVSLGMLGYATCGGSRRTWTGWSVEAFSGLWEFVKLSVASGVMLCLENWYYTTLVLMTGYLHFHDATVALDALLICMNINNWELMIPFAFFTATGVRVANELGARNGKAAKFATIVSLVQSAIIGIFFCLLILGLHGKIAYIFTSSVDILEGFNKMSYLLSATILLNSVQPVLSGWQAYVAYINLGCYYGIGLPLGVLMRSVFHLGVIGIWGGMILGGTAVQTVILAIITIRCDWEKEAEKAQSQVTKWSDPNPNDNR